ncbi:hypothetical protein GCM10027598_78690 [Amycolatopsis oliviviridis]|uniref:YNCE-like beta-propeller domain-containing protein n=1 Tax=Amycolatopsis oliviviridis TaxID=1471590 RepID=A0ABQ3L591_9PSEU|nr:YncE family protein [Amycolatopsis oliviviridis]GHH05086.1 hypothetical protein GCM10017790_08620 [Amycolatopsis oliviviridis]
MSRTLTRRAVVVGVTAVLLGASTGVANAADPTVLVATGKYPEAVAISPDGKKAYVTSPPDATVTVVDTVTHKVTNTIAVQRGPFEVAFTPDGSKAYVANAYSNAVSVIDTASETMVASAFGGDYPTSLTISRDGSRVYVAGREAVHVLDTATDTEVAAVALETTAHALATSPDGTKIWAATESGELTAIDTATNTVVDAVKTGGGDVVLSPDGTRAYQNGGSSLVVVDLIAHEVVTRVPGLQNGHRLAISPDGSRVYAGSRASDTTQGTLAEFDTSTNTLTRKLPAGAYPYGVAVTQDGTHAYVVLAGQAAVAYLDLRS